MLRSRIRLCGLEIDRITEAEAIAVVLGSLEKGQGGHVVTPNVDQLRQFCGNPALASIFDRAELVVADGMPLVWASRLQGTPLPERVAGSDLVWSLCAEAARHERSIFLLGGAPGAASAAADRLRTLYPGATIAEPYSPPFGFEHRRDELERVVDVLRSAGPDIVYVALGFPKQERLIAYLRSEFPRTWFLGVGFSLSFIAGDVKRAPDWMIRLGLEWAHRLAQEPRRLTKRYLIHGLPFVLRMFQRAFVARLRGTARIVEVPSALAGANGRVVFGHGSVERERAAMLEDLLRLD